MLRTVGEDDSLRAVRRPRHPGILLPVDVVERYGYLLASDLELVQSPRRVTRAEVAAVVPRPERVELRHVDPHGVAAATALDDRVRAEEQLAGNLALEAPFIVAFEPLGDERAGLDRALHRGECRAHSARGSLVTAVRGKRPPRRVRLRGRPVLFEAHAPTLRDREKRRRFVTQRAAPKSTSPVPIVPAVLPGADWPAQ